MRLLELKNLFEAELDAAGILNRPGRRDIFLNKIRSGSPFETTDGRMVDIDPTEADRLEDLMDTGRFKGSITIALVDGGKIALGKLQKTQEFKDTTGAAGEEKISNRGDVAEGVLAAAMFAKLKARVNKEIVEISVDDVWAVVDSLTQTSADTYSVSVKDAGKAAVNDKIVFTLVLPPEPYQDFINPAKRALLVNEVDSAARFANSDDNTEFSKYYYLNGRPDIINIICDGGNPEKQKVSKVDIEIVVTDKLTGKQDRKRLDISLKADAAQFGQVGIGSDRLYDFFKKQQELWSKFGIDITDTEQQFDDIFKKKGLLPAIKYIYQFAADVMATLLSYDNDEDEYMFIGDLAKGINYFATLNNPNVILIDFVSGGYKMMKFDDMETKLAGVKLQAAFNNKVALPQVDIYDELTGKLFLKFRVKITATERRNYVEKGPLMAELLGTKVKRLKK